MFSASGNLFFQNFHLDNNSFIQDYLDEEALSVSMMNLNVVCPEHQPRPPPEK